MRGLRIGDQSAITTPASRWGQPWKSGGMSMDKFDEVGMRGDPSGKTVRVSLPAAIAFDLDRFQEVQRSILDRLGCRACCSGWDIRFDLQRRFVVDDQLNIREFGVLGE
jgi:hypothetical protein